MSRLVDSNGLSVEVTPSGYLVRSPGGVLLGQSLGVKARLPQTPADLEALGVDLASLSEEAA